MLVIPMIVTLRRPQFLFPCRGMADAKQMREANALPAATHTRIYNIGY
jgi:hypothetical protein